MALALQQKSFDEVLQDHENEMAVLTRRLQSIEGRLTAQTAQAEGALVTVTKNDMMFGGLGAAAGAGGVYAAGHFGYTTASPARVVVGGVVGLAAGVAGTRYWNRAK
jgi:hypothetical protein